MGFGTLFIGFFLLLNITFYEYTDLLAALIMMLGITKLANWSHSFGTARAACVAFAAVGFCELALKAVGIFVGTEVLSYTAEIVELIRYATLLPLILLILHGIGEISREVELYELMKRTSRLTPFVYTVISLAFILNLPVLEAITNQTAIYIITAMYPVVLITFLILYAMVLKHIYSAYMHICMPEDVDNEIEERPSRFAFINKMRERQAQKSREYAEYKLEKMNQKSKKRKKK